MSREDQIEAMRRKRQERFGQALRKNRVVIAPTEVADEDHKTKYREHCGSDLQRVLAEAAAARVRSGKPADKLADSEID